MEWNGVGSIREWADVGKGKELMIGVVNFISWG